MRPLPNRVIVLVALTLGASACAAILGIDDVALKDAGEPGSDASRDGATSGPDGSLADADSDGNGGHVLLAYPIEVAADKPG